MGVASVKADPPESTSTPSGAPVAAFGEATVRERALSTSASACASHEALPAASAEDDDAEAPAAAGEDEPEVAEEPDDEAASSAEEDDIAACVDEAPGDAAAAEDAEAWLDADALPVPPFEAADVLEDAAWPADAEAGSEPTP